MGNNKLLIFLSVILIIVICACIGCTIYVKKNQNIRGKSNLNTSRVILDVTLDARLIKKS